MNNPVLGIIGGVGPLATAYFMEMIIRNTPAKTDQDNIPMIIFNDPQIPDRTAYILGQSDQNPLTEMENVARWLENAGADYLAIPCNTAHFFYDGICDAVDLPVLSIMEETTKKVANVLGKKGRVGLMATEGTVASKVFQDYLASSNIECFTPCEEDQKTVTSLIYDQVKANKPYDVDEFMRVANQLREDGADIVIVGCTELSVIYQDLQDKPEWMIDTLQVLSDRCIEFYLEHHNK